MEAPILRVTANVGSRIRACIGVCASGLDRDQLRPDRAQLVPAGAELLRGSAVPPADGDESAATPYASRDYGGKPPNVPLARFSACLALSKCSMV